MSGILYFHLRIFFSKRFFSHFKNSRLIFLKFQKFLWFSKKILWFPKNLRVVKNNEFFNKRDFSKNFLLFRQFSNLFFHKFSWFFKNVRDFPDQYLIFRKLSWFFKLVCFSRKKFLNSQKDCHLTRNSKISFVEKFETFSLLGILSHFGKFAAKFVICPRNYDVIKNCSPGSKSKKSQFFGGHSVLFWPNKREGPKNGSSGRVTLTNG